MAIGFHFDDVEEAYFAKCLYDCKRGHYIPDYVQPPPLTEEEIAALHEQHVKAVANCSAFQKEWDKTRASILDSIS